jgi:hypothetical protein
LSSVADRFRGDAGSVDPTKIAIAAAKLGNDGLGWTAHHWCAVVYHEYCFVLCLVLTKIATGERRQCLTKIEAN